MRMLDNLHSLPNASTTPSRRRGWLAVLALLAFAGVSHATPIGLDKGTPDVYPDIMSDFIDVTYTTATSTFLASGYALSLDTGGPLIDIYQGTFTLTATIDSSGILSAATLSIWGNFTSDLDPAVKLVEASTIGPANFGFTDGSVSPPIFEFAATITYADSALPAGFAPGLFVGTILTGQDVDFTGAFTQDFSNYGSMTAYADSFDCDWPPTPAVPEPATLAFVLGSGIVLLVRRRRLSSRNRKQIAA